MKIDNKQVFFKDVTDTDSKKKLNRANKTVAQKILDDIEEGVTIEKIDSLTKDLPVFKYYTQITIHGLFPELSIDRLWGYKNIFQNKNKSIGIRYSAIDEDKRREIYESIKYAGFSYQRNSSEQKFVKLYRTTKDKLKEDIDKIAPFYNKIDTSRVYGGKQLYAGEMMGMYYILLTVEVGAIYQRDVQTLIDSIISPDEISKAKQKEKERDEQREREHEKRRQQEKQKQEQQLKTFEKDIAQIKQLQYYKGEPKEGKYIDYTFNYNDELRFGATYVYKIKGKKLLRMRAKDFTLLQDALEWLNSDTEKSELYSSKCHRISGYIVEENKPEHTKEKKVNSIFIVDYTDKAIAVFGDTKPIKEKLKQKGCRFNPRLNNNGQKSPGWIAPKSKKKEIEAII